MSIDQYELSQHLLEFKEKGYTIFQQLYGPEQISKWTEIFYKLREELAADAIRDMVERSPGTMLPFTANPDLLDFLELVMGPFVQIGDAGLTGFASRSKEDAANKVTGWHRDMYAFTPRGNDYQTPRQILALSYLEDMTEEYGPLRVIPGTHRQEKTMLEEERDKPHPDELVLSLKAGDVIVFSGILHTGSFNTSGRHRILIGGMYTYTWYKPNCNFNGPNIQRLIEQAAERNDLRMLRLFGVHGPAEKSRMNSGFVLPDEAQWQKWAAEDKAALKGSADWWRKP